MGSGSTNPLAGSGYVMVLAKSLDEFQPLRQRGKWIIRGFFKICLLPQRTQRNQPHCFVLVFAEFVYARPGEVGLVLEEEQETVIVPTLQVLAFCFEGFKLRRFVYSSYGIRSLR